IVERVHRREPSLVREAPQPLVAVLRVAVVANDLRAVPARRGDLELRGVVWHERHRRGAKQRGGERHALSVVARGAGDDAAAALLVCTHACAVTVASARSAGDWINDERTAD